MPRWNTKKNPMGIRPVSEWIFKKMKWMSSLDSLLIFEYWLARWRALEIGLQKGAVFIVRVDRLVVRTNFQLLGVLHEEIDKSADFANTGLKGNFLFDSMVPSDDHDQFQAAAGSQGDVSLKEALASALVANIAGRHVNDSPEVPI